MTTELDIEKLAWFRTCANLDSAEDLMDNVGRAGISDLLDMVERLLAELATVKAERDEWRRQSALTDLIARLRALCETWEAEAAEYGTGDLPQLPARAYRICGEQLRALIPSGSAEETT